MLATAHAPNAVNLPLEPIPAGEACEVESYFGERVERRVAAGELDPAGKKVRVVNPRGTPPPIKLHPMAERPATVDGRTIFLVDVRFMNGAAFLEEIRKTPAARVPDSVRGHQHGRHRRVRCTNLATAPAPGGTGQTLDLGPIPRPDCALE